MDCCGLLLGTVGWWQTDRHLTCSVDLCQHRFSGSLIVLCTSASPKGMIGGHLVAAAVLECEPSLSTAGDGDLRRPADMIRGEYLELPGLSLTTAQAQRLWNLDRETCQGVLDGMVREKFLKR